MDRLSMLDNIIRRRPDDPFPRYAQAIEFGKAGRDDEARGAFAYLAREHAEYLPAYLMSGTQLQKMGLLKDASVALKAGVAVAKAASDEHTLGELEAALADLESSE